MRRKGLTARKNDDSFFWEQDSILKRFYKTHNHAPKLASIWLPHPPIVNLPLSSQLTAASKVNLLDHHLVPKLFPLDLPGL